ncbi:uncharacterized protein RJT21DRAFT_42024 [Scheffersomyces amazonensis]|uniref:uncharacterized protein n=1 Tax=Scheffersomyces amazonensis TaxID=1078765 RepID=UPI00315CF508
MTLTSVEQLVELLADSHTYSYVEFLGPETGDNSPIGNTIELFCFGNYQQYLTYRDQYIELPLQCEIKLVKLSVIALFNDLDGSSTGIPVSDILSHPQYGIGSGLQAIGIGFEEFIMDMIDDGLVEAQIDDTDLVSLRSVQLRDAYSSDMYELRVLDEHGDIPTRSVKYAIENIRDWYTNKLIPLQKQLSTTKSTGDSPQLVGDNKENTRKRKTPDHIT